MSANHLILIVDDSADTREMYAEYLKVMGYRVAQAANGHDAVKAAAAIRPDAVVVDLTMPGLDGWEVIERLQDSRRANRTKILILTGRADAPSGDGAPGYDAFLLKPCLPDELERELRRVLASPA